jgi:hypothetical protein
MRKVVLLAVCAMALSSCGLESTHQAKMAYIKATAALNACVLAHPDTPSACAAQETVQQNDLSLYSNLSD